VHEGHARVVDSSGNQCSPIILVTPLAFAACVGRCYLPAIGSMVLPLFLVQIIAAPNGGNIFRGQFPPLQRGHWPPVLDLSAVSHVLVVSLGSPDSRIRLRGGSSPTKSEII